MPRKCSICTHPEAEKINKALVKGESLRSIAERFEGISATSLHRHKKHLPEKLATPLNKTKQEEFEERKAELDKAFLGELAKKEEADLQEAISVISELNKCFVRINRLFDACHEWLKDPDNPNIYSLEPRAHEVHVIYSEPGEEDKQTKKKAPLSQLLAEIEGKGFLIYGWETRHADPRKLTAGRLGSQVEILAKLVLLMEQEKRISALEEAANIRQR